MSFGVVVEQGEGWDEEAEAEKMGETPATSLPLGRSSPQPL